ncbi:MAG TPA: bifunctional phosphoribosyl-AMP cyclohydrolase/phosphoribosyl-ATP diphosphatase HisIE [Bacteroidota bacterium]|nr:bifunctional phosphoribosyl-AMP cyclohydrolase/phosphoribosyl-ATP diphosphatase HisIE [Bacteroidota bacterium]
MNTELQFSKMNGLLPAVIQHARTGAVLMVGFMNRESLELTEKTGEVHFWSRTKKRIWKKGESSGNAIDLVSIHADCDRDTLLIRGLPRGPVCHTGAESCFEGGGTAGSPELQHLADLIQDRKIRMPDGSYTAGLFSEGIRRIAQKVGEEGVELAIAAQYDDRQRIVEETADLLFHTLVVLAAKEIPLSAVLDELAGRER